MMRSTRAPLLTALLATVVVATAGAQEKVTLHMTGPAWGPISLMTEISKDFTAYAVETLGYEVEIQLDPVPWGSYYERLAAALAAGLTGGQALQDPVHPTAAGHGMLARAIAAALRTTDWVPPGPGQ